VQIGLVQNTEFLKGTLELSRYGEIIIDPKCATSLPGVFAAGDVTTVPYKQIVIAAGEGSKAALSAFDHLIRTPAQATPLLRYSVSPGTPTFFQRAPVARITERLFSAAPLASVTVISPCGSASAARVATRWPFMISTSLARNLGLQRRRELRALGVHHRDVVLDAQRVQRLATEALGDDAGADALARRVHSRCGAGRATADDQHVEAALAR
jgi:hypothetical protein